MITQDQIELAILMQGRNISRLYVEVYKQPTGYHSIEEMEKYIIKCNEIIGNREEEISNISLWEIAKIMNKNGSCVAYPDITIKRYYELAEYCAKKYKQCSL